MDLQKEKTQERMETPQTNLGQGGLCRSMRVRTPDREPQVNS
jgi:hypothetical protein